MGDAPGGVYRVRMTHTRNHPLEQGRIIIVANRLPVTMRSEEGDTTLTPSGGGLATGLRPLHEKRRSVWIGSGSEMASLPRAVRARVACELHDRRIQPVEITRREAEAYYDG